MKIMPLTIINIFAVMEIIGLFRHSPRLLSAFGEASYGNEVLQKTEVISLVDCFISFAMTGTIYFLAMIMAESLFLVFGIILIVAFYLIEKLKNKI